MERYVGKPQKEPGHQTRDTASPIDNVRSPGVGHAYVYGRDGGYPETLAAKFEVLFPHLDEWQQWLLMGAEARALGRGAIGPAGLPGSARPRCCWEWMSWTRVLSRWAGAAAGVGDASGRPRIWIRSCARHCSPWWSRGSGAIRCRRWVDDHVDPSAGRGVDPPGPIRPAPILSVTCCGPMGSACRATPRPSRASATRTRTRSPGPSASCQDLSGHRQPGARFSVDTKKKETVREF